MIIIIITITINIENHDNDDNNNNNNNNNKIVSGPAGGRRGGRLRGGRGRLGVQALLSIVLEAPIPKMSLGDKTSLHVIHKYSDKQNLYSKASAK